MAQHTGSAPTAGKWRPPIPNYFVVRFWLWSWQLPAHICPYLSLRLQPPLGPCELLHSLKKKKKANIFYAFKQPGLLTRIRYACDNLEADSKLASEGRPKFALPSAGQCTKLIPLLRYTFCHFAMTLFSGKGHSLFISLC